MDEEIATLTHLLNQDYGYRNIFDDYTESDLQQVLPIYGAHHGSRPLVAELSSLFAKIATSSSLICNIHSYIFSKKVYVSPKKQSYQNTFPNYSKISIRSHDRWIANIYLSIF